MRVHASQHAGSEHPSELQAGTQAQFVIPGEGDSGDSRRGNPDRGGMERVRDVPRLGIRGRTEGINMEGPRQRRFRPQVQRVPDDTR